MEDSGRDKLQGQNAAGVENNNADAGKTAGAVDFHSSNIATKSKDEHFTIVEGAAERARAAEKAKADAEKAAKKAKKRAKKEQRIAAMTEEDKKGQKRKLVIIIAIIIVSILGIVAIIFMWLNGRDARQFSSNEDMAMSLYDRAIERSDFYGTESDYAMGLEVFAAAKKETTDETKLAFINVAEAKYAITYGRFTRARELLNEGNVQSNEDLKKSCLYIEVDYQVLLLEGNYGGANELYNSGCFNKGEEIIDGDDGGSDEGEQNNE